MTDPTTPDPWAALKEAQQALIRAAANAADRARAVLVEIDA